MMNFKTKDFEIRIDEKDQPKLDKSIVVFQIYFWADGMRHSLLDNRVQPFGYDNGVSVYKQKWFSDVHESITHYRDGDLADSILSIADAMVAEAAKWRV